jgi:uncharacterized protein (DUF2267 family)
MKSHQPQVFGSTLEKTNRWVNEISDLLHWDDHHKAYHGLRAVLHVLRDRLPVPEAAHLGAQLPMLVRGFYYDNWKPAATPIKIKMRTGILRCSAGKFQRRAKRQSDAINRGSVEGARRECLSRRTPENPRNLSARIALALAKTRECRPL